MNVTPSWIRPGAPAVELNIVTGEQTTTTVVSLERGDVLLENGSHYAVCRYTWYVKDSNPVLGRRNDNREKIHMLPVDHRMLSEPAPICF